MSWTNKDIEMSNHFNKSLATKTLKMITDYRKDTNRDKRLEKQLCLTCYYLRAGIVAGQAFTEYTCRICGEKQMHPNTNTPKICKPCAVENDLCVKCGGGVDIKAEGMEISDVNVT